MIKAVVRFDCFVGNNLIWMIWTSNDLFKQLTRQQVLSCPTRHWRSRLVQRFFLPSNTWLHSRAENNDKIVRRVFLRSWRRECLSPWGNPPREVLRTLERDWTAKRFARRSRAFARSSIGRRSWIRPWRTWLRGRWTCRSSESLRNGWRWIGPARTGWRSNLVAKKHWELVWA